jgi:2'-5' RNA ligase
MRLFTAVEIGEHVQAALGDLMAELRRRAQQLAPRARVTWVAPERAHLTLRFIGEVDGGQGARIVAALREPLAMDPFAVQWGGLGAFPPRGAPRALWVGVAEGDESLMQAESDVSRRLAALGIPAEDREYRPHLTLARVRDAAGMRVAPLFEDLQPRIGETRVDAITLFQSKLSPKGPAYTILQRTMLRDG